MARISRIVIPQVPHQVTQRGNRRLPVFFEESDYAAYLAYLADGCAKTGTELWAYCLMPDHVHLLLVPRTEDGLRGALGEAHRRYTRRINFRENWRGHLWQERFASFPVDEKHLLKAAGYMELNPVRARLAASAGDYPWSSARAHLNNFPDPPLKTDRLLALRPDWREFLAGGLSEKDMEALRRHEGTGRPLGGPGFLARIEARLGRTVAPGKPGRKPKAKA
ncbi:MAG: transposase [Candidatus Adiutrix sp.]|jgi:putative transposase|nr:transposase [Candidatus Adiutrix sp.]